MHEDELRNLGRARRGDGRERGSEARPERDHARLHSRIPRQGRSQKRDRLERLAKHGPHLVVEKKSLRKSKPSGLVERVIEPGEDRSVTEAEPRDLVEHTGCALKPTKDHHGRKLSRGRGLSRKEQPRADLATGLQLEDDRFLTGRERMGRIGLDRIGAGRVHPLLRQTEHEQRRKRQRSETPSLASSVPHHFSKTSRPFSCPSRYDAFT